MIVAPFTIFWCLHRDINNFYINIYKVLTMYKGVIKRLFCDDAHCLVQIFKPDVVTLRTFSINTTATAAFMTGIVVFGDAKKVEADFGKQVFEVI